MDILGSLQGARLWEFHGKPWWSFSLLGVNVVLDPRPKTPWNPWNAWSYNWQKCFNVLVRAQILLLPMAPGSSEWLGNIFPYQVPGHPSILYFFIVKSEQYFFWFPIFLFLLEIVIPICTTFCRTRLPRYHFHFALIIIIAPILPLVIERPPTPFILTFCQSHCHQQSNSLIISPFIRGQRPLYKGRSPLSFS